MNYQRHFSKFQTIFMPLLQHKLPIQLIQYQGVDVRLCLFDSDWQNRLFDTL